MSLIQSHRPEPGIDIIEHRHRLGVWASARAAQRGWLGATVFLIRKTVEQCGVLETVRDPGRWPGTAEQFDAVHKTWVDSTQSYLQRNGLEATFGRCAKVIAIYLKVTVITAGYHDAPFARVIHPPIDEILLKSLARDDRFPAPARRLWRRTKWTKLDATRYAELIESFRAVKLDMPVFWMIERYWQPDREVLPV